MLCVIDEGVCGLWLFGGRQDVCVLYMYADRHAQVGMSYVYVRAESAGPTGCLIDEARLSRVVRGTVQGFRPLLVVLEVGGGGGHSQREVAILFPNTVSLLRTFSDFLC